MKENRISLDHLHTNYEGDFFMENKNVLYIDYLDSYMEIGKYRVPKWIKWVVYKVLNYFGMVRRKENYLCLYSEKGDVINERMLRRIYEIWNEMDAEAVVCADLLLKNELFMEWLRERECTVLNGMWLFKFLMGDILEKIAYIKNVRVGSFEVSVFIKRFSDYHVEGIKMIAKKCKVLNVITDNVKGFEVVEKRLLEECGVMVNVTSNVEKSSKRADVIFNFDFEAVEIGRCRMKDEAVLVQMNGLEFARKEGIVVRFCKLEVPVKYDEVFAKFKHFKEEILYESVIYHKNSFKNVMAILRRDNVNIRYFIGNNGKINFREFLGEST